MSLIRVQVDQGGAFGKGLTELERTQLPFATRQAMNATAFDVRQRWAEVMPRIFDRPVPLTQRAVLYDKASKARPYAEIYIRDEATKGTPPAKYLQTQVMGGSRRPKGIERQLSAQTILPAGMFVVPGRGAKLDQYGNIPRSQLNMIKSQLGAQGDPLANESEKSRGRRLKRNAKRGKRDGNFFAVRTQRGRMAPGIYERITTGFGSAVRSVLRFVKSVSYRRRYPIFDMAQKIYDRRFPDNFQRELTKAVASSFERAFR